MINHCSLFSAISFPTHSSPQAEAPDIEALSSEIFEIMWPYVGTYVAGEKGRTYYYIMDEVGSRFLPSELGVPPDFDCGAVFIDFRTGATYTLFWPIRDIEEGETLYCSRLPHSLKLKYGLMGVLEGIDDLEEEEEEEGSKRQELIEGAGLLRQKLQVCVNQCSPLKTIKNNAL